MKLRQLGTFFAILALATIAPRSAWSTVSNTVVSTTTGYGNGVTTIFTITFDFRATSQVVVTKYDTSTSPATVTTLSQGAGAGKFQVTKSDGTTCAVSSGGPGTCTSVKLGTAPSVTQYLVITRNLPFTQPVVFNPASIFPYQGLSNQLDEVTLLLQNLNAGIGGGSGGGGGGSGDLPSGVGYNFLGWNSAGSSVVNYPNAAPTTGDVLQFNGSTWAAYSLTQSNLMQTLNSSPNSPLSSASGGTGVTNVSNMTWGTNPITWTTTGTTNVTLPTSGTLLAGTATNNNTASTVVKRDSSGNFSAGTVTANLTGNVTGNLTGNVTGNTSGTASNVTGTVAIGNGGTGQTTRQAAINGLLNSSGASSGTFARYDGTNVTLGVLQVGDVPQGFSRAKLAQATANTLVTNDASGNMSVLTGGLAGNVPVFDGVKWVVGPQGTGIPGVFSYGVDTGAADAYVVASPSPPVLSYAAGTGISFVAANTNSGAAATINVSGLGAKSIKHLDGTGLTAQDIIAGQFVLVGYDGTNFQLLDSNGTGSGIVPISKGGTGASTFTVGSVVFMGPTAFMQDNSKFFWNDTSNFLGIGTAVPDTYLTVNSNAAAVPTSAATATVHIADVDGVSTTLLLDAFNVNPNINLRRAQGTAASPTNVLSGGALGSIAFSGYGATGYITSSGAKIDSKAAEDWTDSTGAALMTFSTRPSGSIGASTERMRIDQNGNVGIGTTGPASKLHVSATVSGTPSTVGSTTNFSGGTFTDNNTASSGTTVNMTFNTLQIPTLAATNTSVTTTNSSSFYIAGAVKAGSNETLTNSFSEFIATDTLSSSVTNGYGLEVNAPSSATNNYSAVFLGGNTGFGTASPNSRVHVAGNTSGTPSTTGSTTNFAGGTFTDSNTAGSGTAATMTFNTVSAPTLAATNASVTTTNSSSLYIAGPVKAGSNETLTNSFGEYVSTVALSGSVTNGYGLEVNAPTAASNNYSAAFLGGNTGFKTAAPKSVVDVSGNISAGSYAGSTAAPSNGMIISGTVGIGTSAPVGALTVAPAPTPTATMGSLNLGEGGFAGSAGNFSGSASGTELAINAVSGYAGNLVDYQVNGVSKYSVSATGAATLATALATVSGGTGLSSPTAGSVLVTNGSSALNPVGPGTSGNVLTSNGTTWVSAAPAGGSGSTKSAFITNNGSVWTVGASSPAGWLTSPSRTSTGGGTLTIVGGSFAAAPHCACTAQGGAVLCTFQPDVNETTAAITTTTIPIKVINSTTGSGQDNAFFIECHGD